MDGLWQDLRHGGYMLRKNLAFTAVAALTLAVGIGSTTTIFGVVDAVMLRPLPFTDPNRIVQVWETTPQGDDFSVSEPDYLDFAAQNGSLSDLAAYRQYDLTLTGNGDPRRLRGVAASHSLFPLLGIRPSLGRTFTSDEDAAGDSSRVVILSNAVWLARFGADSSIVGRVLTLNGAAHTVIGILPAGQRFPAGDAFVPLHASARSDRGDHWLHTVGRLRPGVTVEQAQNDFTRVSRALATAYPASQGWGARVEPLSLALVDAKVRRAGWVLLGATSLLLLLACANVANLLLVRATARETEMGVRAAIGAGEGRLIRQLLIETGVLVVIAAVLGMLMAMWGTEAVRALGAGRVPRLDEV
ncbi:MAG TPA: ABC transporter permease, partial [Gemmatimonadaceae bacterium]